MLDFLGIGAQKAGTTWLYEHLAKHPNILFPADEKEIHFFDRHLKRGFDWYNGIFSAEKTGVIQGEITPAYATLQRDILSQIQANYPDLKLIYMVRDPIDRAWSSAKMALWYCHMELEEASDQWFVDHFRSKGSQMRGAYETCLRNWVDYFAPSQLCVIHFDRIQDQPVELLNQTARFLGVHNAHFTTEMEPELQQKVFAGASDTLRPSLRPVLEELYRGSMESLETYLRELERAGCQRFW